MATPGLPTDSLVITITVNVLLALSIELFIFFAQGCWHFGWYLADQPFNTDAEKAGAVVHMRFTGTDEHDLAAHCPYWSPEPLHGIEVKRYASWLNEQEDRMKDLEAQVAVSEDAMNSSTEQQGQPTYDGSKKLGNLFNTWYYQFYELGSLVDQHVHHTH